MFDVNRTLELLAFERKLFHSEADFQHALAMMIAKLHPSAAIRLEVPIVINESRIHQDIRFKLDSKVITIELKYATTRLAITNEQESFDLRDQSADDLVRYGFCKDIERIEQAIEHQQCTEGYAIILTNYPPLWKAPIYTRQTNDMAFRIHEGLEIHGELSWGTKTNAKSIPASLKLQRRYTLVWHDYSLVEDEKHGHFRYTAVHVS